MRCSRVYLTEKGYDLAKYRLEILKKLEQNAKKDITPKELRDATYVLETFLKNLMENKNKA
jgi:DNA-binding MarR family transcriptional regulator